MRYAVFGIVAGIAMFALASGDGHGLAASILRGFGWGVGREVAHDVVRHMLR